MRALWMVLITSLAAPFFVALIVVGLQLLSPATDFLLPFRGTEPIGEFGIDTFVWSALPATVAALGLTPFVLQHGAYTWLQAAVAGVWRSWRAQSFFRLPAERAAVPGFPRGAGRDRDASAFGCRRHFARRAEGVTSGLACPPRFGPPT